MRPYIDPKPWKCFDIDCETEGFKHRKGRDDHVKRQHPALDLAHLRAEEGKTVSEDMLRPYKCSRPECHRSVHGFSNKKDCLNHIQTHDRGGSESLGRSVHKKKAKAIEAKESSRSISRTPSSTGGAKPIDWLQDEDESSAEEESDIEPTPPASSKALIPAHAPGKRKHRGGNVSTSVGFTSMLLKEVQS